jgi:hypothetical protein
VYLDNAKSIYPTIVGVALLLQITVVIVVALVWRRGLRLFRWSEKRRRRGWGRAVGRELCECMYDGGRSRQSSLESEMSLLRSGVRVTST